MRDAKPVHLSDNQYGQVLTAQDPAGNLSSYTYYSDTSFSGSDPNAVGHTIGDLQTLVQTVSAGKTLTTTYTSYTKAGQLLESQDPNGVLTDYTYLPRGWLHTASVAGQTTTYDYWPTGLLKPIFYTLPEELLLNQ